MQPAPALPLTQKDHAPADALRSFLSHYPGRVLIAADSAGRREALREVLEAAGVKPAVVESWAVSVSYTHLDVYKRQVLDIPPPKPKPPLPPPAFLSSVQG